MNGKKTGRRTNNEGSVHQQPNGKWRAMVSLGYEEDGSRKRVSQTFDTKAEANTWRINKLSTAQQYGAESAKDVTGMFIPNYHRWMLDIKQNDVQSRQFKAWIDRYNKYIKPYFSRYRQKEMTSEIFKKFFAFLERQGLGNESRRKIKNDLRQYFEHCYADSPMRNPLDKVVIGKKKRENVIVNPLELQENYKAIKKDVREKFLKALDDEKQSPFLKPLCYLMYFIGNRIGETLALQWKDFNFERRYFYVYKAVTREYEFDEQGNQVGKSKKAIKSPKSRDGIRPLPLIDILYEAMMQWRERRQAEETITGISFTAADDFVFANRKGEIRSEWGTYSIFRRFLTRNALMGQNIHFHALRQTFSNSLFAKDSEDQMITDTMGHSNINTTKRHYKSIEKFDSVHKVGQLLNSLYPPTNQEFKASDDVTFTPEGYMTETETMQSVVLKKPTQPARVEASAADNTLAKLFKQLSKMPEFRELVKKAQSENEME